MFLFDIIVALAGLAVLFLLIRHGVIPKAGQVAHTADTASLLTSIPGFLCLKDADGHWLQVSQRYADIFNLTDSDCIGKTDIELSQKTGTNHEALRYGVDRDREAWDFGHPLRDGEMVYPSRDDGSELAFDITRTPLFDGGGRKFRLLITSNFLSPLDSVIPGLFASVFYMNKMPFALLDSDFKTTNVNRAFAVFTGYSKSESAGKYFVFLDSQRHAQKFASTLRAWFRRNPTELWSAEVICRAKNGNSFPIKLLVSAIRAQARKPHSVYYFACLFDITKQKEDEKRIMQNVHYDGLTGLPNRALFCDQLARSLFTAMRHKLHTAVLSINLDRFKTVNDSLGHQTGDALLKRVAERLVDLLGEEELAARLGGDEFVVMCCSEQTHEKAIYSSSIAAQNIVSRLSEFFYIQHQEIFVSASIGIAIFPEDADSPETLLKNADMAMAEAKKQGRNRFKFFHRKHTSTAKDRHQIELGLRKALPRRELQLYYQPQYEANNSQLCGAEALVRWLQGRNKLVSPYYFIDIAEESGLIIPIGKWILESACKQQKAWLDAGYAIRQVSVNVSARQFMDAHFVETVEECLAKTKLEPTCLELEITESLLVGDTKKIQLQLKRLKQQGIKIALDDFGTGYSSLAYLKNFPIDVMKIDQSFVRGISSGSKDAKIICAIIEMGHSLGCKVVAEGVEDEAQFRFLNQQGCDIIQGYYFSRPLPVSGMAAILGDPASQ